MNRVVRTEELHCELDVHKCRQSVTRGSSPRTHHICQARTKSEWHGADQKHPPKEMRNCTGRVLELVVVNWGKGTTSPFAAAQRAHSHAQAPHNVLRVPPIQYHRALAL